MLDRIGANILRFLSIQCEGVKYKILSLEEIVLSLPQKYRLTSEEARKYILELIKLELVSVKYEDEQQVCLALTVKGRAYIENKQAKKEKEQSVKKTTFFFAFIGSFLGSLLPLLFYIIRGFYVK